MKLLMTSPYNLIPWEHRNTNPYLMRKAREERDRPSITHETIDQYITRFLKNKRSSIDASYSMDSWGWVTVPPIIVIQAPNDLEHIGSFVVYNGHHRRRAGTAMKIPLPVAVLENTDDLLFFKDAEETIEYSTDALEFFDFGGTFEDHKDCVWERARKYNRKKNCQLINTYNNLLGKIHPYLSSDALRQGEVLWTSK